MNSVLVEIYSTIIPSAPYLIAAYALIWLVLLAFVFVVHRNVKKANARMALIEEELAKRASQAD